MKIKKSRKRVRNLGEAPNGGNKKTKQTKFSENEHSLHPDTHTHVCVSGGKKIWCALFSCYLRFKRKILGLNLEVYSGLTQLHAGDSKGSLPSFY